MEVDKINLIIDNKFTEAPTSIAHPRNSRNKAFKQPAIPFFNENSSDESIATWHPWDFKQWLSSSNVNISSTNSMFPANYNSISGSFHSS